MAYVSATISAETVLTKCANSIQIRYICELGYVWNRLTLYIAWNSIADAMGTTQYVQLPGNH